MDLRSLIKPPMWAAFHAASRVGLMLRNHKYRYVFILGHIRSGSTLLAHILANHADMIGAGETHIVYKTPADLQKLVLQTCDFLHRPILREKYVVDQINHDYVADEVLLSQRVHRCVILIREPDATLKSMAALKSMKHAPWQEAQGLKNYVSRLETLTRYGMVLRERALAVEYDDLIDHSAETLARITEFLGLMSPLVANYATNRMTGRVAGIGDPSNNIKAGRVTRTPKHEIPLSAETLSIASAAYLECQGQLQRLVRSERS